jgi:broad specificity phosphatase PhoE
LGVDAEHRRVVAPVPTHQSLDGLRRRRIYLFRHGDVSYVDPGGLPVPNARLVRLTERGREQAIAMSVMMRDVEFDLAICSGLPRTQETAALVLGDRSLPIRDELELEEIKPGAPEPDSEFDLMRDVAYAQAGADSPDGRLLNGESFAAAEERALAVLHRILAEDDWSELALFAHGGINGLLLGWALGVTGRTAFASIEQDMCCVNVIDIDQKPGSPEVVRRIVRLVNGTTYDPSKNDKRRTAWEEIAAKFMGL